MTESNHFGRIDNRTNIANNRQNNNCGKALNIILT